MLDYNIEYLFEHVFQIRREFPNRKLHFISNWDNAIRNTNFQNDILEDVFISALSTSTQYKFAYEQFDIKSQILDFFQSHKALKLFPENISISPGATQSIFLASKAVKILGRKRVLLVTPAYFSTYYALTENNFSISFYHLTDQNDYKIDFNYLTDCIKQQFIDVLVITDPVYCSGIDFNLFDYNNLASICNENNVLLFIDFSLGGLLWNDSSEIVISHSKIDIINKIANYVFIESITKRLSLNGVKFSILIGSESLIDKVDSIAESIYGGLSSVQCELMKKIYRMDSLKFLENRYSETITKVTENKKVLESLLMGSNFELCNTSSGYFTTLDHKNYSVLDIDAKAISLYLLNQKDTLVLTKDKLSYYPENKFGFRLNLCQEKSELLFGVNQCIGIDYEGFEKRK